MTSINVRTCSLLCVTILWFQSGFCQEDSLSVPLFEGLGDYHFQVSTTSEKAQEYFNQGIILTYGFNYGEAHRSFLMAAKIDSTCAMAYWGASYTLGPNINAAMLPENVPKAQHLIKQAKKHADRATKLERDLIQALNIRYGKKALKDSSPQNQAYADAMANLSTQYPENLDIKVLYAESLMNTTPWDYWQKDGTAKPVTHTILDLLQYTLEQDPRHLMANHLFIHTVEAQHPELGIEEAKRLEDLVPGAGHLVHMPSHIYIRIGEYHEATKANQRAIQADKRYLNQVESQGVYKLAYVPHNYHFLWASATFEGRSELAIQSAKEMAAIVDTSLMRTKGLATLQHYWITPLYALVRFGKWNEILEWGEPAHDLIYPRAVWHYARGMAYSRKQEFDLAEKELASLNALRDDPGLQWVTVWDINKSKHILAIASHALAGEINHDKGNFEESIKLLTEAVKLEDSLNYDEPPTWHYPMRQSLGAVLLDAHRYKEAIDIYKEDLKKFPGNGWSLFGLMTAYRMRGEEFKAKTIETVFKESWIYADVVLTSSRY